MKILLTGINAKYIHSNPAIHSLAAYASQGLRQEGQEGWEITLAEYTINQRKEDIVANLYEKKPDILAFSCYIWNWGLVQEIMVTLHKLRPELPIWLGGPEVSYTPEKILEEYPFLAGIMVGEGEATFLDLCRMYRKGEIRLLPGTVTGEGRGADRRLLDMDTVPFFYEDMEVFSNRIVYYESSRGCPYRCSYCLSSVEKQLRLRDIQRVKEHLDFFLDKKVVQVKFIDRTFNSNHEYACEIWKYIREKDNGVTNFHFEIAADILTEEELSILEEMRPGLVQLEIGIQTTNPQTLQEINRRMDLETVRKRVNRIREMGNVHQHLDLIAGLPEEDYSSFQNSFNWVYHLQPDQLQLGFLKVLKGSPLWEKADRYGIIYDEQPPYEVLKTRWLDYEEIRRLKEVEEVLELYYNSGQFAYTMAMLETVFESPFVMYDRLARFIRKKGLFAKASARSSRYDILLAFIREEIPGQKAQPAGYGETGQSPEEMWQELLTFDLYLREKMKTRPGFCRNLNMVKEEVRKFYRKEEEERRWLPKYGQYDRRQLEKMTHLEYFQWKVWEKGSCVLLEKPAFVLFDYQERNPLSMAAAVWPITQLQGEEK